MTFLNPSHTPGNTSFGVGSANPVAPQGNSPSHRELMSQILRGHETELQQQWGGLLRPLRSLSRETDAQIFYDDLYRLARDAESQGSVAQSFALYQGLVDFPQTPAAIRSRAQTRLNVLQGSGPLADRIERWGGQLLEMATDPAMIVGMGIDGLAFRGGRLMSLRGLMGTGLPTLVNRPLALLGGLGAESLAFTVTTKGVRSLMGHREDWGPQALRHDFLSTGILLGCLRMAHTPLGYLSQGVRFGNLAQHLGTYGGIVLGHHFQAVAGFRDPQKPGDLLTESLATFFQFAAGGAVARQVFGSSLTRLELRLENQIRDIESSRPPSNFWGGPQPVRGLAMPGVPNAFAAGAAE